MTIFDKEMAEDAPELTGEEMEVVSGGLNLPLFRGYTGVPDDSVMVRIGTAA
jgi:hypothetical protein